MMSAAKNFGILGFFAETRASEQISILMSRNESRSNGVDQIDGKCAVDMRNSKLGTSVRSCV